MSVRRSWPAKGAAATGAPPIPSDETLEIMVFMEAADLSKARGGAAVALSEVTRSK